MTADKIKELIGALYGVSLVDDFTINEAGSLKGRIAVTTAQDKADLEWDVEICPAYPFKAMGRESIYFKIRICWTIRTLCKAVICACIPQNMRMLRGNLWKT